MNSFYFVVGTELLRIKDVTNREWSFKILKKAV